MLKWELLPPNLKYLFFSENFFKRFFLQIYKHVISEIRGFFFLLNLSIFPSPKKYHSNLRKSSFFFSYILLTNWQLHSCRTFLVLVPAVLSTSLLLLSVAEIKIQGLSHDLSTLNNASPLLLLHAYVSHRFHGQVLLLKSVFTVR